VIVRAGVDADVTRCMVRLLSGVGTRRRAWRRALRGGNFRQVFDQIILPGARGGMGGLYYPGRATQ